MKAKRLLPVEELRMAGRAKMAIAHIAHMGCTGSEACRHCSKEEEAEEAEGSRADCNRHCTLPAMEAGIVADCMGAACCHGAYPALPADDDRSSCRRGRIFQTDSDVRDGLDVVNSRRVRMRSHSAGQKGEKRLRSRGRRRC
jgi:hypothetical protein